MFVQIILTSPRRHSTIDSVPLSTMFSLATSTGAFLLLAGSAIAQRADGQFWPCNPLFNATGACPPNPGLPTNKYEIDFTKIKSIPDDWTISNYATINFGPDGAEFTFNKRYDAPQLWTNFFIFFGRVDVEMRVANGTGMISSAVLISDDFDEIGMPGTMLNTIIIH